MNWVCTAAACSQFLQCQLATLKVISLLPVWQTFQTLCQRVDINHILSSLQSLTEITFQLPSKESNNCLAKCSAGINASLMSCLVITKQLKSMSRLTWCSHRCFASLITTPSLTSSTSSITFVTICSWRFDGPQNR